MSAEEDKQEIAHLEQLNEELTESLERCRSLLFQCREKLAANSNAPEAGDESERFDQQG